jgi:hypothetical protein
MSLFGLWRSKVSGAIDVLPLIQRVFPKPVERKLKVALFFGFLAVFYEDAIN